MNPTAGCVSNRRRNSTARRAERDAQLGPVLERIALERLGLVGEHAVGIEQPHAEHALVAADAIGELAQVLDLPVAQVVLGGQLDDARDGAALLGQLLTQEFLALTLIQVAEQADQHDQWCE